MKNDPIMPSGNIMDSAPKHGVKPAKGEDKLIKDTADEGLPLVTPDVGHEPDGQVTKSN